MDLMLSEGFKGNFKSFLVIISLSIGSYFLLSGRVDFPASGIGLFLIGYFLVRYFRFCSVSIKYEFYKLSYLFWLNFSIWGSFIYGNGMFPILGFLYFVLFSVCFAISFELILGFIRSRR